MRETLDESSDSKPETLSNCRRDGNGRRICPSLCARGPRCGNRDVDRAQEDRHLAPQAERRSPSRLRGLLRTRGGALGSRRRDLLPGAYTGAVTDTELRTITVDYTVELARVLHASSPGAAFS